MRIFKYGVALIALSTSLIHANSLADISAESYKIEAKTTQTSALARISTNRYTKGVKYNYYHHKEIAHRLNTVNPIGIMFHNASVSTTATTNP